MFEDQTNSWSFNLVRNKHKLTSLVFIFSTLLKEKLVNEPIVSILYHSLLQCNQ